MDLDQLILSGKMFNGNSGSSSPARSNGASRSPSPDPKWPTEDFDEEAYDASDAAQNSAEVPQESIGMGPGRTGVKGVIRDRDEAVAKAHSKRSLEISALNRKMEATSLAHGGRTWEEDENDRRIEKGLEPIYSGSKASQARRFGYLREVGATNYVDAVEEKHANVIVHIYDPSLERCSELDGQLAQLARSSPLTKFIRVRATAIGFAIKKDTGALGPAASKPKSGDVEKYTIGEDSEFGLEDDSYDDEYEGEADLDMLPTMLIYHAGELLHTWVRVDWEAGKDGVENLLIKNNLIARQTKPGAQGSAALSDDEEEEEDE